MLRWPDWLHQLEVFYRCLKTLFDARLLQTQTLQDLTLLTFAHCLKQKTPTLCGFVLCIKKKPQGVRACVSQLSLAHLRCLFLSCRATANVQNVLQRQSGLKTERDGKRIDTPLAAATALGGCELYSYPASGEMKRQLGGRVEGGTRTDRLSAGMREGQVTYLQMWGENL